MAADGDVGERWRGLTMRCLVQRRWIRFCEGEASAARLYKPALDFATLTPCTVPTPASSIPTLDAERRRGIPVQSNVSVYLGHGVPRCSIPAATHDRDTSSRSKSRARTASNERLDQPATAGISTWETYSTGACPWHLPEVTTLIDYRRWLPGFVQEAPSTRQTVPISRHFHIHTKLLAQVVDNVTIKMVDR